MRNDLIERIAALKLDSDESIEVSKNATGWHLLIRRFDGQGTDYKYLEPISKEEAYTLAYTRKYASRGRNFFIGDLWGDLYGEAVSKGKKNG